MRAILASRAEVAPTSADAVGDVNELHEPSLARPSDISEQVGEHCRLGPQHGRALGVACLR